MILTALAFGGLVLTIGWLPMTTLGDTAATVFCCACVGCAPGLTFTICTPPGKPTMFGVAYGYNGGEGKGRIRKKFCVSNIRM